MTDPTKPLTDEELAEVRRRAFDLGTWADMDAQRREQRWIATIDALRAEVESWQKSRDLDDAVRLLRESADDDHYGVQIGRAERIDTFLAKHKGKP